MHDDTVPDFTGKVLAVALTSSQMSLALEQVRYERHLGKLYLVGRQLAHPRHPNWADGATYYIAPEQIAFFAVFDSLDDYLRRSVNSPHESPPAEQSRRGWLGRKG